MDSVHPTFRRRSWKGRAKRSCLPIGALRDRRPVNGLPKKNRPQTMHKNRPQEESTAAPFEVDFHCRVFFLQDGTAVSFCVEPLQQRRLSARRCRGGNPVRPPKTEPREKISGFPAPQSSGSAGGFRRAPPDRRRRAGKAGRRPQPRSGYLPPVPSAGSRSP